MTIGDRKSETARELMRVGAVCGAIIILLLVLSWWARPNCPAGSHLQGTRSGWFCVVEPLKRGGK